MNKIVRAVALSLIIVAELGHFNAAWADQNDIDLKNTKAAQDLADKQKILADTLKKIADVELEIVKVKISVAEKQLEEKRKLVERVPLPMQIISGEMMVVRDHALTCNAVPFLNWKCQNTGVCDFPVDKDICGWPGKDSDTMQLTLSYRCGTRLIEDTFWTGKDSRAYLSCR